MKLIKLSETHYIVVDDSEIKKDNWCLLDHNVGMSTGYQVLQCVEARADVGEYYFEDDGNLFSKGHLFYTGLCKKITRSTKSMYESKITRQGVIDGIKAISLSEIEEAIYGYSVEKMADEVIEKEGSIYKDAIIGKSKWIEGFNAHKELTKNKLFTIEDMYKCFEAGNQYGFYEACKSNSGDIPDGAEYINNVLPKTEWNVDIVNNKLILI